ncbi:MAG TPA: sulfur carrier protein ThiS [Acidimicrobiales bacterium]|nr:sulfur carrier protein ThiS [Acidimicrobiales bacterium]
MIRLNGVDREGAGLSIASLLAVQGIDPRGIAVAVDGEIVRRSNWADTIVKDESSVEIVTAAAGG